MKNYYVQFIDGSGMILNVATNDEAVAVAIARGLVAGGFNVVEVYTEDVYRRTIDVEAPA